MVEDLRRLLNSASSQEKPFMFVGSDLGALIARFYAQIYDELDFFDLKIRKISFLT